MLDALQNVLVLSDHLHFPLHLLGVAELALHVHNLLDLLISEGYHHALLPDLLVLGAGCHLLIEALAPNLLLYRLFLSLELQLPTLVLLLLFNTGGIQLQLIHQLPLPGLPRDLYQVVLILHFLVLFLLFVHQLHFLVLVHLQEVQSHFLGFSGYFGNGALGLSHLGQTGLIS